MLKNCGQGALRLECRLKGDEVAARSTATTGRGFTMVVGLFQPTASSKRLFELVQIQLERLRIASPVTDIYVSATLTAPLEPPRQTTLFDQSDQSRRHTPYASPAHGVCGIQTNGRPFSALVERLGSRLGREAVVGVRLRPEAQPELSWHYEPLLGGVRRRSAAKQSCGAGEGTAAKRWSPADCRRGACTTSQLPPRPLRLLPRPLLLAATSIVPDGPPLRFRHAGREYKIAHTWGPERIETGWWRGRAVGRDYFRVETTAGRRFWLFRRLWDGKWFLHGMFE